MRGGPVGEAAAPDVASLLAWIVERGLEERTHGALLAGLADRMLQLGLPLWRCQLSFPTLDPTIRGENHVWLRGRGVTRETVDHDGFASAYAASPFPAMERIGRVTRRWRLTCREDAEGFPVIVESQEAGATDFLLHLVRFGGGASAMIGTALSVATDRAAGFTDREVELLAALAPTIGLAAYRIAISGIMGSVLCAYIGRDAGERVLEGEIRRGVGQRRYAALLVADLAGFTAAAGVAGHGFIARLGEHLAAMAEPVEQAGGAVLKFLGDGLIASWPADEEDGPEPACAAALRAGLAALGRNEAVNRARPGETELGLKIALHLGEVFYGNVGAGTRLDFTVIGPAVNEACRIEGMCGTLQRPLLMSGSFARACGRPTVSLGRHELRGVAEPCEIFTIVDG